MKHAMSMCKLRTHFDHLPSQQYIYPLEVLGALPAEPTGAPLYQQANGLLSSDELQSFPQQTVLSYQVAVNNAKVEYIRVHNKSHYFQWLTTYKNTQIHDPVLFNCTDTMALLSLNYSAWLPSFKCACICINCD